MGCSIPVLTLIHIKNDGQQGFRQFSKVADIFLKAANAHFCGAARRLVSAEGASYLGGSGGMAPGNFYNNKLRNAVSSFVVGLSYEGG